MGRDLMINAFREQFERHPSINEIFLTAKEDILPFIASGEYESVEDAKRRGHYKTSPERRQRALVRFYEKNIPAEPIKDPKHSHKVVRDEFFRKHSKA
jgi:hypothetical protein